MFIGLHPPPRRPPHPKRSIYTYASPLTSRSSITVVSHVPAIANNIRLINYQLNARAHAQIHLSAKSLTALLPFSFFSFSIPHISKVYQQISATITIICLINLAKIRISSCDIDAVLWGLLVL